MTILQTPGAKTRVLPSHCRGMDPVSGDRLYGESGRTAGHRGFASPWVPCTHSLTAQPGLCGYPTDPQSSQTKTPIL